MKRVLQIFRDGRSNERYLTKPLAPGEQGNLQTVEAMANVVREDRLEPDLRAFVLREIVGPVPGHDAFGELGACFDFAQKRIIYRRDPFNVERVADIWSTLYALNPAEPEGDCGIKSVFFATCAALLGYKPFFVLIKQRAGASAYNHVYCAALVNDRIYYYDPTPEDAPAGFIPNAYERVLYPIF